MVAAENVGPARAVCLASKKARVSRVEQRGAHFKTLRRHPAQKEPAVDEMDKEGPWCTVLAADVCTKKSELVANVLELV